MPTLSCENCTRPMEQVDEMSWMCVPCRRNEYWLISAPEAAGGYLQREFG